MKLFAYILGSKSDSFSVDIDPSQSVEDLKKVILNVISNDHEGINVRYLKLYKVELEEDGGLEEKAQTATASEAKDVKNSHDLSNFFENGMAPKNKIHIVVMLPPKSRPEEPAQLDELGDLFSVRKKHMDYVKKRSPSSVSQPKAAPELQNEKRLYYDRPPFDSYTIPVTLLHPVFNQFLDDCKQHPLTRKDHSFALTLSHVMSNFSYPNEAARQEAFVDLFREYDLPIPPSVIGVTNYKTDGDMKVELNHGIFRYCIVEVKDEVGSKGAEPVIQASCYFFESLRHQNPNVLKSKSPFPCLALYVVGPILGFVGMVFNERTHIQVLGPALRMDYHPTDVTSRRMLARSLGAFRNAVTRLEHYYRTEFPVLAADINPCLPCYYTYQSVEDHKPCTVKYERQLQQSKLVFFGNVEGTPVCVKFTTKYSAEAHKKCVDLGIAPKLLGFKAVGGDWLMVVMESIIADYISLADAREAKDYNEHPNLRTTINDKLKLFSAAGFVHGDLRDTNVMVRRDGGENFKVVDFDWAGNVGEARYPMNINKDDDLYLAEAEDEVLITTAHDEEMISRMFQFH